MKEVIKELTLLILFTFGIFLKMFDITNISFLWSIALSLLVYFSALNISFGRFHHHMEEGMKLLIMNFVVNMLFMTLALNYVFGVRSIFLCMFFSSVISGLAMNSHKIMGGEAILSPFFSILIPVFFLEMLSLNNLSMFNPVELLSPLAETLFISIGSGVVFAMLGSLINKKVNLGHHFTAIALYFFTEFLNANGVISVFAFGLFLGNVNTKKHYFSLKYVDYALFIVAGYLIYFHNLLISIAIFLFFLFLRFIAIEFSFFQDKITDKLDLIFLRKKGSTSIAMALLLGSYILKGKILLEYQSGIIINLILMFVLFTNITTFIYDSSKRSSSQRDPRREP